KSQNDYRVIDPTAIVSEVNRMLCETLDKRIALKSSIDPETWPIKADATQIHQVIMNLCINAHDAIQEVLESDGRRWDDFFLLIEMGNAEIDQAYCQIYPYAKPGRYMYISITDNGPGMDDETRQHLFEPFFTTKKIGKGTGLGLATAFGIIKQHRGWINVYSRPGAGSTFRLYLPRSDKKISVGNNSSVDLDTPGGTETILLIDDEEVIRKLGKAILERKGYTVLLGCDGRDGLDVFCREQKNINLVILDLTMPHLSGLEVLQQINLIAPETKVIMSSGYTDQKRADKLRRLGAAGFVAKPYNIKQLAESVRQILDQDLPDNSQTA
nr:response regulator [bacterium]